MRQRIQAGANRHSVLASSRRIADAAINRCERGRSCLSRRPIPYYRLSRRRLLQGTAGLAAAGLTGQEALAAKDLVVGFIYVGPKDDYGYNQAHAEAACDAEEDARRQDRRGRKGPRNRRRFEDHGKHDQAGRRDLCCSPPALAISTVHAENGRQV